MSENLASEADISTIRKLKMRWSAKEDEELLRAIKEHGPSRWNEIAELLADRTGKQCRERWITRFSPNFSSEAWTHEEDMTLIRLQTTHGNQWSKFKTALPRRSAISIKNRWVSLRRKVTSITTVPPIEETGVLVESAAPGERNEPGQTMIEFDEDISFLEFEWLF
jgi:hypothetical protein